MVIGTIGNTHGVSSDSAPINAASPRYAPIVLALDETARSGTRFRGEADLPAGAAFNAGGVPVPSGGAATVLGPLDPLGVAACSSGASVPTPTLSSKTSVFGGRHRRSLHVT